MGGCCVGNCFDCCVAKAIRDLFCSDSGCGYHPGPSSDELHAKKIADELAQMKENIRKSTEVMEQELMDDINQSIDSLIKHLDEFNKIKFGEKFLNLNVAGLRKETDVLKQQVKGHIGDVMDERLVLTDKELSIILAERDDKKRAKNFDAFCMKIKKQALSSLKEKIEATVNKQSLMVRKEIETRLREVDNNMKKEYNSYLEVLNNKKKGEEALELSQMKYMYAYALNDILIDEIND